MGWSCGGNVPVWTQSTRQGSTIAPEIVFVVSAEGVRIFKIALVSLRSTRAILKILTPSSDTTHTISGQAGTFPLQDHRISTIKKLDRKHVP